MPQRVARGYAGSMKRPLGMLTWAALACACGGGAGGLQTAVTGSVYDPKLASAGQPQRPFLAQDAIVNSQTGKGFSFNGPAAYVQISDFAGACADEGKAATSAAYQPATGQTLVIGLA